MSDPFSQLLAQKTRAYIESNPDKGRIYAAGFIDSASADAYAEALVDSGPIHEVPVEIRGMQKDDINIVNATAVQWGDRKTIVARAHHPKPAEGLPAYHHGSGFATILRNKIGNGDSQEDLVLIADFDIETISNGSENIKAEGGPLDPATIYLDALERPEVGDHGRAVLDAVKEVFPADSVSPGILETTAQLVHALETEEHERVPEILGQYPRMMKADSLGPNWFAQAGEIETLTAGARNALKDNRRLADQIQSCHTVGTNTASCLEAKFGERVAQRIQSTPDWRQLGHAEIKALAPPRGGIKFQEISTQPTEFRPLEAPADPERQKTRTTCIRIPVTRNEIQLRLKFSRDLEQTPFEVSNATCEARATKALNELICTFEPPTRTEAYYATVRVWLGNTTTSGQPRLEFQVALLPLPVYNATRDAPLLVDPEHEALVARHDAPIELAVGGDLRTHVLESPNEQVLVNQSLSLEVPSNLISDEDYAATIQLPEAEPVRILWRAFTDDRETSPVTLPLAMHAIANPEEWSAGDGMLGSNMHVDYYNGTLQLSNGRTHECSDQVTRLLQLERDVLQLDKPAGPFRISELDTGTLQPDPLADALPESIQDATKVLWAHFRKRERTPSLDSWDEETCLAVRNYLESLLSAVPQDQQATLRRAHQALARIGAIEEQDTGRTILTPYHPVNLAYQLRLAEFRNQERSHAHLEGLRDDRLLYLLDPTGHLPFIGDEGLKRGSLLKGTLNWLTYTDRGQGARLTPAYVERIVKSKISKFIDSYPALVAVHKARPLVINCVQLGDLEPVLRGLFGIYRTSSKHREQRIQLRIFGDDADGAAVDAFFDSRGSDPLRVQLEKQDDAAVASLLRNVSFTKQPLPEAEFPSCHIALVRNILDIRAGTCSKSLLPNGSHDHGLFSLQSSHMDADGGDLHFTLGFGASPGGSLIERVANAWNPLFAAGSGSYDPDSILKRTISSTQDRQWDGLWKTAVWVIHVEPNVGLDFYRKGNRDNQALLIHYSDQYEPTSPEYDAITSTRYKQMYTESLEHALDSHRLAGIVDADTILDHLMAIDGGVALELQRSGNHKTMEFIGLAGSLAVGLEALRANHPDHQWIVLSLDEIVRQSRRSGSKGRALFQFEGRGRASDDLCFVGINPKDPDRVPMVIVESKGGTSSPATGMKQVVGAIKQFNEYLHPEDSYADKQLLRAVLGRIIIDAGHRLQHYGLVQEAIPEANREALISGRFQPWFPQDKNGCRGLVIQVRKDVAIGAIDQSHDVALLQTPTSCLRILQGAPLGDCLLGVDTRHLALQLENIEVPKVSASTEDPSLDNSYAPNVGEATSTEAEEPLTSTRPDDAIMAPQSSPAAAPRETASNPAPVDPRDDEETPTNPASEPEPVVPDAEEMPTANAYDAAPSTPAPNPLESNHGVAEPATPTTSHSAAGPNTRPDSQPPALETPADLHHEAHARPAPRQRFEELPEERPNVDLVELGGRVQQACAEHGILIRPINHAGIQIGPRHITVPVALKPGQDIAKLQRNLENIALKVQAAGPITARTSHQEGIVKLLVPHNEPATTRLGTYYAKHDALSFPSVSVPLGADSDYRHQHLDLTAERHVLVAGATGSGKSSFLKAVLLSLAAQYTQEQIAISILDPKGLDFGAYPSLPHVGLGRYVDDPESCVAYLEHLLSSELPARKAALRESGYPSVQQHNEEAVAEGYAPIPHHIIVVDEYADLSMSAGKAASALEEDVCRLAQVGRAFGYSIILATQRPSADIVSGKIKANFPCRMSFRLPSGTDSKVILDETGAEDLLGNGDAIVKTHRGALRVQSYFVPVREERAVIATFQ